MSPRERVFDILMRRFDAMEPFKPGLRRLGCEALLDPATLLAACGNIDRMARWVLEASGAQLSGPAAGAARHVLALVYGRVFNVWLRDQSPDLARTMAELDKRLQQAQQLGGMARRLRRNRGRAEAAG
jgi:ubiquinone biosynthesis protein COQ9